MWLHGETINERGQRVGVSIITQGRRDPEVAIGSDGIHLTTDGVATTGNTNDIFDVLQPQSATIKFLVDRFMPDLFGEDFRDVTAVITLDGTPVFAGYVEPQTYSQPFDDVYDELAINCIDALSALSTVKYKDVGSKFTDFHQLRGEGKMITLREVINEIVNGVAAPLADAAGVPYSIDFMTERVADIYDDCALDRFTISELLFLGDTEEDTWTQQEVLEAVLRYLDLHIVQDGMTFHVFGWEDAHTGPDRTISTAIAAPGAPTLAIGEVYNQISVACDVVAVDTLMENPMESKDLTSGYRSRQLYILEGYRRGGEDGDIDINDSIEMCRKIANGDFSPVAPALHRREWTIRQMKHPAWSFNIFMDDGRTVQYGDQVPQNTIADALGKWRGAAIVRIGMADTLMDGKDNSVTNKMEDKTSLIISVNGDYGCHLDHIGTYPDEEDLKSAVPRATFSGGNASGNLSPSDDETTNYIVFSGHIVLNKWLGESVMMTKGMPIVTAVRDTNGNGMIQLRGWYKASTPGDTPVRHNPGGGPPSMGGKWGFLPWGGLHQPELQFKYSAIGDSQDHISKIGAVACMLIVGDKCVVETGASGQPSDFRWKKYRTREECADDDEYYAQCFTLGFDPKIGDHIIGQEYELQNNIHYSLGIDASGTAIPVRKSDGVSGKVTFMILGPVNLVWDEVTRRHRTWFRKEKWSSNAVEVLPRVSNIQLLDFEAKIYSDNAHAELTDPQDLIYLSDDGSRFVNPHDDVPFRLTSALTSDERDILGVPETVALSTPIDTATGTGVTSILMGDEMIKPEEAYVNAYYRDCRRPMVSLSQNLWLPAADRFGCYRHPAHAGKVFHVVNISRDLMAGSATVDLREIANG